MNYTKLYSIRNMSNRFDMILKLKEDVKELYDKHKQDWPTNIDNDLKQLFYNLELGLDNYLESKIDELTKELNDNV